MINASPDFLVNAAGRSPEGVAVVWGERKMSFATLDASASALARLLVDSGLLPGDRFALLSPNHPAHIAAQLAACRTGTALVPLNTRLSTPELSYIVSDSGTRLLLVHEDYARSATDVLGTLPGVSCLTIARDELDHSLFSNGTWSPRVPPDPEAVATILYTSGTTGRPKGAMISNRALNARIVGYILGVGLRRGCVYLQTLPMFHIASTISFAAAYLGGVNVILEQFSADGVQAAIRQNGVTHTCLVPTMIHDIAGNYRDGSFASVETVLYGGSPISPADLREARRLLMCQFVQAFGQTETGPITFLEGRDHLDPARLRSAGRAALGHEIAILDHDGRVLASDAPGEIAVRGPQLMNGYWNLPLETAEAKSGGWLHTGDLGHLDAAGYLYVTDRLKDMLISGGENVYPREVELVVAAHPQVQDVAVIGLPHERLGEIVCAVVVADPAAPPPEPEELERYCRQRLAGYKVPRVWTFSKGLPRNAIGKVLKTTLRAQFEGKG